MKLDQLQLLNGEVRPSVGLTLQTKDSGDDPNLNGMNVGIFLEREAPSLGDTVFRVLSCQSNGTRRVHFTLSS